MSKVIAPFVLLPAAVAAAYFILGHFAISGTQSRLDEICSYSAGDAISHLLLPYTSSPTINERLCGLVEIFHGGMATPDATFFTSSFAVWFAPICFFILVEAARPRQCLMLTSSMVVGILYQVGTAGAITSLYWLVFVLFSNYRTTDTTRTQPLAKGIPTKAHAEAITFGFLAGAVIPTIALLNMQDPYVTVLWQPFPIYVAVFYHLHLLFRTPSNHATSGFPLIQAMYIIIFVLASSFHFATIWPRFGDWEILKTLFVPSIDPVPQVTDSASIAAAALHLLQYDAIFSVGSSMVGTLWFASSFTQALRVVVWYIISVPVCGPSAALATVFLWRESGLAREDAPLKKVQ